MDPFFEILKNTTIKSLPQFSMINKKFNELCHDKYFWIEKFKHDNLPLFSEHNDYNEWIKEYNKMYDIRTTAKKVLIINDIERKRTDKWESEGCIEIFNNENINITNFFDDDKSEINDIIGNLIEFIQDYYIYRVDNHYILQCIIVDTRLDYEYQHDFKETKSKNDIITILTHLIYYKCKIQDISFDGIPFLIAEQEPPINYSENEKLWFNRRVGIWEALDYLIDVCF